MISNCKVNEYIKNVPELGLLYIIVYKQFFLLKYFYILKCNLIVNNIDEYITIF